MKKSNPHQRPKTKSRNKQSQSIPEVAVEEEEESPTDFSFKITRVAVSQICRSVGFKASQLSALQTLTLIATKYLQQVAQMASSCSRHSNRTQSNLFDLINALHDLSSPIQGFIGASSASNSNSCLLSSGVLREISGFVNWVDEIPFAKSIPRNHHHNSSSNITRLGVGQQLKLKPNDSRSASHIPKWLPAFPEPGTYKECKEMVCITTNSDLWENSEFVQEKGGGGGGGGGGVVEPILGGDLAAERGKVMFKFGVKAVDRGVLECN